VPVRYANLLRFVVELVTVTTPKQTADHVERCNAPTTTNTRANQPRPRAAEVTRRPRKLDGLALLGLLSGYRVSDRIGEL